ncbi:hypothetical protein [Hyphomicrobium sp.]|uniref:hypothetical protein n=1 Tax=Hyphomicrobium sp. TaxID=82 RepID=UPI0025B9F4D0|nr:hypothetical protein [Hyphomicrobium sp.]
MGSGGGAAERGAPKLGRLVVSSLGASAAGSSYSNLSESGVALSVAPPPFADGGAPPGAGAPGFISSISEGASAVGGGALLFFFGASPHEAKATAERQRARTPNLRKAASPNPHVTWRH